MEGSRISVAIGTAGLAAVVGTSHPAAADDVSFAGKTITMTIGNAAGSGIDLFGRVLGRHLAQHLPGILP
jgi:tripartite-type tricarboxylate transporter receptor subunit TctC